MSGLRFEWDSTKAASNKRKHGVSFEEAASAFLDEHAIEFYDEDAVDEERFWLLGMSLKPRLLLVCHCYRQSEGVIRIISARRATKAESMHYRRP